MVAADWTRAANQEQAILKRHVAVTDELESIARAFHLSGAVSDDREVLDEVDANRWETLLKQEAVLRQAGLQWVTIYADRKRIEGQDDPVALAAVRNRHDEIAVRANKAARHVAGVAASGVQTKPRPEWLQLLTNGIILGGGKDRSEIAEIEALRKRLTQVAAETPSVALEASPLPSLRLAAVA
ncbi:MAG: hypothetical protein R2737_07370 [Candidatus Nanopelagicales bacterium]